MICTKIAFQELSLITSKKHDFSFFLPVRYDDDDEDVDGRLPVQPGLVEAQGLAGLQLVEVGPRAYEGLPLLPLHMLGTK